MISTNDGLPVNNRVFLLQTCEHRPNMPTGCLYRCSSWWHHMKWPLWFFLPQTRNHHGKQRKQAIAMGEYNYGMELFMINIFPHKLLSQNVSSAWNHNHTWFTELIITSSTTAAADATVFSLYLTFDAPYLLMCQVFPLHRLEICQESLVTAWHFLATKYTPESIIQSKNNKTGTFLEGVLLQILADRQYVIVSHR